jgi:hypothetical protein
MNTTTWNPHRYIEYFGSEENLKRVTGLNDKAFHKAVLSKRINEAVKSYLDKTANFCLLNRFTNLDDYIERGETKHQLMKRYKCGPVALNEEMMRKYNTILICTAMAKVKCDKLKVVNLSAVNKELIFAIKKFKAPKAISFHLCVSDSGLRHRFDKSFKTSNIKKIIEMIEAHEKIHGTLV